MNREQLRQEILAGIDRLAEHPHIVGAEQMKLLAAQKTFWQQDDGTQLDKLLSLLKE